MGICPQDAFPWVLLVVLLAGVPAVAVRMA